MSRSERLLALLQKLRHHRHPIPGRKLAQDLGISLRTLYRDIVSLQEQGAVIEGEAGLGYVLRPGFTLPPLVFSGQEIEALVLGSRWVADRGDEQLAEAAREALTKIAAVLPERLREELESTALLIGPAKSSRQDDIDVALFRQAIREERKMRVTYVDLKEKCSERVIWPFALSYFEPALLLIAWCESRQDFRHFRIDRIEKQEALLIRYPKRRQALLHDWKKRQGLDVD